MIRSVCLAAAAALFLAVPSSASAYWPYCGGFGQPWGVGYGFNANAGGFLPAPPYFSVYPPVYYSSQITMRHYGASPFAWPAGMHPITYVNRSAVAVAEPLMIENPYVKGTRPASATTDAVNAEIKPLRIDNPYLAQAGR